MLIMRLLALLQAFDCIEMFNKDKMGCVLMF
jgi:hypothetical protein